MKAIGKLKIFISIFIIEFSITSVHSQSLVQYSVNKKWGFKKGEAILIEPQYDTVFGFDQTQQICLVGNINPLKRGINPLTKQLKTEYIYFYINSKNQKQYIRTSGTDSTFEVSVNKSTPHYYLNNNQCYVAMVGENKFLISKKGGTISGHPYSNIKFTKLPEYYTTYTRDPKTTQEYIGLVNSKNKEIIPPLYSKISFNTSDSLIYCCTAGIKFNGSDDVYNYGGGKIHSSNKHIQFASKKHVVYKLFESEYSYIVFDMISGKEKPLQAEYLYYLQNETVALLDGEWYFYNLNTDKRYPIDKKLLKYLQLND